MTYKVECFNADGRKIGYGYGYRGRVAKWPHWYPHPSSARVAESAVLKNNPEVHCFIKPHCEGDRNARSNL